MSGCVACGRALYFSERVAWPQEYCFPCAVSRGIVRLCDEDVLKKLRTYADALEPWWRWTLYLQHAMRWDDSVLDRSLKYRYTDDAWKGAT